MGLEHFLPFLLFDGVFLKLLDFSLLFLALLFKNLFEMLALLLVAR